MRSLPLLIVAGLIVIALGANARRAGSSPFGHDIWTVRLDATPGDHWVLLDTGHIRLSGQSAAVFLLAHPKESAPAGRYDAMKVVGGARGSSLWTYDGAGSDYVDASETGGEAASEDVARVNCAPKFLDVDGDGSDDVVFIEQDFTLGRRLRAVQIEP